MELLIESVDHEAVLAEYLDGMFGEAVATRFGFG